MGLIENMEIENIANMENMEKKQEKAVSEAAKEAEAGEMPEASAPEPQGRERKLRRGRWKYALLAIFLILAAGAGYFYYRGVVYYRTHFFPDTSINGIAYGDMEAATVVEALDERIKSYALAVIGREHGTGESGAVLGVIAPDGIGLQFADTEEAVASFLEQQDERWWIKAYLERGCRYSLEQGVVFDESLLEKLVGSWDACREENMRKPEDAYISGYSEVLGGYEVIPETLGTELDMEEVLSFISQAIMRQEASVDLEALGCYSEALVKRDDRSLNDAVDTANRWLGAEIACDWNGTEVVLDRGTLKDWVSIAEGEPKLDEDAVKAFVKKQAASYDTYGKKKKFMTTQGLEVTLASRNYGWKTDIAGETEALLQLIYQGSGTKREPVYSVTARQKGMDDVGKSYVEADLSSQHLYLYQEGNLVLETDFVSGTMISTYDCVTPEGIFGLTYKTLDAVLRGATYTTPVKYWMPFYGNYGMHDANWRSSFGGEIFKTSGSHGCINLPPSKAEEIYQYVSKGFPIVCYYSQGIPYVGPPADAQPGDGIPDETPPSEGQSVSESQPVPEDQPASESQSVPEDQPASESQPASEAQALAGSGG